MLIQLLHIETLIVSRWATEVTVTVTYDIEETFVLALKTPEERCPVLDYLCEHVIVQLQGDMRIADVASVINSTVC